MVEPTGSDFGELLSRVRGVLDVVMPIPPKWLVAIAIAAALSTVEITRTNDGVDFSFRVTAITAVLVALAWLPALVRVIALVGGALKTPAGEAQTGGVWDAVLRSLPLQAQRDTYAAIAAGASSEPVAEQPAVRAVGRDAERRLAALAGTAENARAQLEELARRYEHIRDVMDPGSQRTFEMEKIVAAARGLATAANYTPEEVDALLSAKAQGDKVHGDRIIGLACVEATADVRQFDMVLQSFTEAQRHFDQYHALRALEVLLPSLNREQRGRLADAIRAEQEKGKFTPTSDRGLLSTRLLRAIERSTP